MRVKRDFSLGLVAPVELGISIKEANDDLLECIFQNSAFCIR